MFHTTTNKLFAKLKFPTREEKDMLGLGENDLSSDESDPEHMAPKIGENQAEKCAKMPVVNDCTSMMSRRTQTV